jgi:translation initiation factor 2B subunit (eIF-2B alpha/beta/delta family)
VSPFASDRASGSGSVANAFLAELERWLGADRSPSAAALRGTLLEWLRAAQAAQPSMALVHQLAARALSVANAAVARGDSPVDLREALAHSCRAERDDLAAAVTAAAKVAAELVPQGESWIATLSMSGAVAETLRLLHRLGRKPRVLVAESRPRMEGREMAALLAADGIPVWLVADAALPMLVQQAGAVLLGADALTEHGALNKVGSFMAALAAREHGVPAWAIGVRKKLIPAGTASLAIAEMPPAELWDAPPPGVRPRNVYFELVPVGLLRGVVVEDSVLGPSELAIAARDRALPPELAEAPARR